MCASSATRSPLHLAAQHPSIPAVRAQALTPLCCHAPPKYINSGIKRAKTHLHQLCMHRHKLLFADQSDRLAAVRPDGPPASTGAGKWVQNTWVVVRFSAGPWTQQAGRLQRHMQKQPMEPC